MRKVSTWVWSGLALAVLTVVQYAGPIGGLHGRSDALGDATHQYVLSSPIFSPKTGTSFTTLFTSIEDVSMSMLLRRYDAVGTLLTSQSITIGAHGSLQASPAAHSGAPLHVEIWAPLPGIAMLVTYTDGASVAQRIEPGDMFHPRGTGAALNAVSPARLCDTRSASTGCAQGKRGTSSDLVLQVTGAGGILAGATAATLNLTATDGTASSHLTIWPDGEAKPATSVLNFATGETIANMVTVKLGSDGAVRIANGAGLVHVIVDAFGFYL